MSEAEVYWSLAGRGTSPEWTSVRGEQAGYTLTHTIPAVTRDQVGFWACHVITSFDSAHSAYAELSVRSGTRILEHPQDTMVLQGNTAEFQ